MFTGTVYCSICVCILRLLVCESRLNADSEDRPKSGRGVWSNDEQGTPDGRPSSGRESSRGYFGRNSRGERSSFRGGRSGRGVASGRVGNARSGVGNPYAERWAAQEEGHREIKDARARLNGAVQLYGVAPVLAALRAERREMHTLYIQVHLIKL